LSRRVFDGLDERHRWHRWLIVQCGVVAVCAAAREPVERGCAVVLRGR
jgi:hypothetical protein